MPSCDNCYEHVSQAFYQTFSKEGQLPVCQNCHEANAGIAEAIKQELEQ